MSDDDDDNPQEDRGTATAAPVDVDDLTENGLPDDSEPAGVGEHHPSMSLPPINSPKEEYGQSANSDDKRRPSDASNASSPA